MKKILLALAFVLSPVLVNAADRSCPDYCANGNFYSRGSSDRSGVCIYLGKQECQYGCDGREKCLEGKDCSPKCENDTYYYDGSFSARTKDCQYETKKCEYGCTSRGCKEAPATRICKDKCQDGTFYSNGNYNTLSKKCEYKKEQKCVCDPDGKKCLDVECSDLCINGTAYSKGSPTAEGKCKFVNEEKCENGCDEEGRSCVNCQNRCHNGNYYTNGSYQNAGAGKKACVFDEKICDAGCDDQEGCKKCTSHDDCAGKNICKNGSILSGWCSTGTPAEDVKVISGWNISESGCYYNLTGACVTGICNPFHKDMCGIIIGPAVYEDSTDGKAKPIPGALVKAVWKTPSGSEDLPTRMTDETGHANFTDEELYRKFPDESASLEITVSRENLPNVFNVAGDTNTVTRVIEVGDLTTYKADFVFGNMSNKNAIDAYFQGWEKEMDKGKPVDSSLKPAGNIGNAIMLWFGKIKNSITNVFDK